MLPGLRHNAWLRPHTGGYLARQCPVSSGLKALPPWLGPLERNHVGPAAFSLLSPLRHKRALRTSSAPPATPQRSIEPRLTKMSLQPEYRCPTVLREEEGEAGGGVGRRAWGQGHRLQVFIPISSVFVRQGT